MNKQLKNFKKTFLLLLGAMLILSSCEENDEVEIKPEPSINEVEIGSGNNGTGVIGRDFHFNAEVIAGDKIDSVSLQIVPRADETYSGEWSFEILYMQYKGAKNATIHKHFDIPEDAVEGKYDFLITVTDENGTKLKETQIVNIYLPENLPVDPQLAIFNIGRNDGMFYGDGMMYILIINKDLSHRPETIDDIDFSKAIVYDVYQHEGWEAADYFSNSVFDVETFTIVRSIPSFIIGTENDNNAPEPNPINESKDWKAGGYYFGVVYKNITYGFNFHHYIEFEIEI